MHRKTIISLIITLVLLPWLGIPLFAKNIIITICTIALAVVLLIFEDRGVEESSSRPRRKTSVKKSDSFVENKDEVVEGNKKIV